MTHRQILLDTETTGIDPKQGHRVIEIGAVEMVNRRLTGNNFHHYLQPDREIDQGAVAVHGITNDFLADKPRFTEIAAAFLDYILDAELIIHNAPFDIGFLNSELRRLGDDRPLESHSRNIIDTLEMARTIHPGQRNSLDALCKRYEISNAHRQLHGALLDAEILADVYRAMTGGQGVLFGEEEGSENGNGESSITIRRLPAERPPLPLIRATAEELTAHEQRLDALDRAVAGTCVWRRLGQGA